MSSMWERVEVARYSTPSLESHPLLLMYSTMYPRVAWEMLARYNNSNNTLCPVSIPSILCLSVLAMLADWESVVNSPLQRQKVGAGWKPPLRHPGGGGRWEPPPHRPAGCGGGVSNPAPTIG